MQARHRPGLRGGDRLCAGAPREQDRGSFGLGLGPGWHRLAPVQPYADCPGQTCRVGSVLVGAGAPVGAWALAGMSACLQLFPSL